MSGQCSIVGCKNKCVPDGIVCKGCLKSINESIEKHAQF